jgi:hypothetical protein
MVRVKGGYGRVVWMPTFDAENHVRKSGEKRPFVSVTRDGRLLPEVREVLALVAKHDLTLGTGHLSPDEVLLVIAEARKTGVRRIVVTHAMLTPVGMDVEHMRRTLAAGTFVEFVYNALIGANKAFEIGAYAEAIRAVGPDNVVLTSDLGQAANPLHPDGYATFLRLLRGRGFSQAELDRMSKVNPAAALGLR